MGQSRKAEEGEEGYKMVENLVVESGPRMTTLVNGNQRYAVRYWPGQEILAAESLRSWADDPTCSFSEHDRLVLAYQINLRAEMDSKP